MSQSQQLTTVSTAHKAHDASDGSLETDAASGSISESAYRDAFTSLDENQKRDLTAGSTAKVLFEKLLEEDQRQQEKSLVRRGLKAADPYLKKLKVGIDLASPFVSLNAPAGTALGLVNGVVSVSQSR